MHLKLTIRSLGLRVVDFAEAADLSRRSLTNLIRGYDSTPTLRTRSKVLNALRRFGWQGEASDIFPQA